MMLFGLPYMGSKNAIAQQVVAQLPDCPEGTLYDLFCGGCAITHAAMLATFMGQRKFSHYVINDLNPMMPEAFNKAMHGGFRDEKRWISREDFHRLKAEDAYAAICFSFGNDANTYAYSQTIEPYKRACHYAVIFGELDEFNSLCPEVADVVFKRLSGIPLTDTKSRRIELGRAVVKELKRLGDYSIVENNPLYNSCHRYRDKESLQSLRNLQSLQSLQSLERLQSLESLERLERLQRLQSLESLKRLQSLESLQSLERLERLQSLEKLESLERLERLTAYSGDYQAVPLKAPRVIYCDIPYKGTGGYVTGDFDYERFYSWCERQELPVYISEYNMPADRFTEVYSINKNCKMCAVSNNKTQEKLFVPIKQKGLKIIPQDDEW